MNRDNFIKQTTEQLTKMNVPYKVQDGTDISISATFKNKDDDSEDILYTAFFFLNPADNKVYAYQKALAGQNDVSNDPSFVNMNVKRNDDDSLVPIGLILGSIAGIAASLGFVFQRTDNQQMAVYPKGYIPASVGAAAQGTAFCTSCGAKMPIGTRFCTNCGADSQAPAVTQPKPFVSNDAPPVYANVNQKPLPSYTQPNMQNIKPGRKTPVVVVVIAAVLIIGALVTGGILLRNWIVNRKPSDNVNVPNASENALSGTNPTPTGSSSSETGSSVVSAGVSYSDLGNIMNGQYYFATDEYVFYSSYDTDFKAHIYSVKKDGTEHKAIFNGFGWSLVVIDDWLYFSGNQGDVIDGTYNIFRMRLDGSSVERINNTYSYGMFLYDEYLYYMKMNTDYTDTFSICRSSLDGSNEEILFPYGSNPVVYDDLLYYFDNQGNMFRTKPDGLDPEVLITGEVGFYVLSNDKLIYKDFSSNIYTCDLDGGNKKLVRSSSGISILTVNSYNERIYFVEYNPEFNYSTYSWDYDTISMKMDGSDEKVIFSSSSYGMYMNIVDGKLMMMDYLMDPQTAIYYTYINIMNLDGTNLRVLER